MEIVWTPVDNGRVTDYARGSAGRLLRLRETVTRHNTPAIGVHQVTTEERVILVGDINELGGLCDDCMETGEVVAYSDSLLPFVAKATGRDTATAATTRG